MKATFESSGGDDLVGENSSGIVGGTIPMVAVPLLCAVIVTMAIATVVTSVVPDEHAAVEL